MRTVNSEEITKAVREMCISANCHLNPDIREALENGINTEKSEVSKGVLKNLLANADIADRKEVPICQDTGMAVFFVR